MLTVVHSFDVTIEEAKRIQHGLRALINLEDVLTDPAAVHLIGGADVAFVDTVDYPCEGTAESGAVNKRESASSYRSSHFLFKTRPLKAIAGVVTLDAQSGAIVEQVTAAVDVHFPYIPGFLSFREGPALISAMQKLSRCPDVMIYDGCGIAHPRGVGLAAHMAVLTGIPSIGCAKSLLCGMCEEPGLLRGSWTFIYHNSEVVGACLRTRYRVKPVYVSPGSGFSVASALEYVLSLARKHRLPEPTRLAHTLVTLEKKKYPVNR